MLYFYPFYFWPLSKSYNMKILCPSKYCFLYYIIFWIFFSFFSLHWVLKSIFFLTQNNAQNIVKCAPTKCWLSKPRQQWTTLIIHEGTSRNFFRLLDDVTLVKGLESQSCYRSILDQHDLHFGTRKRAAFPGLWKGEGWQAHRILSQTTFSSPDLDAFVFWNHLLYLA